MDLEGSLSYSQAPATCLHPEPDQCSLCSPIPFPEDPFQYYSPIICLGLPSGLFPSGFLTKTLYAPVLSPMRATFPTHVFILSPA